MTTRPKSKTPIQVRAGRWYAVGHGPPLTEECCDCGKVHRTTFKLDLRSGRIYVWVKWDVDDKETRKARRRPQKFVRRKKP